MVRAMEEKHYDLLLNVCATFLIIISIYNVYVHV